MLLKNEGYLAVPVMVPLGLLELLGLLGLLGELAVLLLPHPVKAKVATIAASSDAMILFFILVFLLSNELSVYEVRDRFRG